MKRITDRDAGVPTNDGDDDFGGLGKIANNISNKRRCANDIEGGDTEQPGPIFSIFASGKQAGTTHFLGSKTPCFLRTSATIGTVELTGLEMTRTNALGAVVAIPVARSRTIPALI